MGSRKLSASDLYLHNRDLGTTSDIGGRENVRLISSILNYRCPAIHTWSILTSIPSRSIPIWDRSNETHSKAIILKSKFLRPLKMKLGNSPELHFWSKILEQISLAYWRSLHLLKVTLITTARSLGWSKRSEPTTRSSASRMGLRRRNSWNYISRDHRNRMNLTLKWSLRSLDCMQI